MDRWYAGMYVGICAILTVVLVVPVILYYGFDMSLSDLFVKK